MRAPASSLAVAALLVIGAACGPRHAPRGPGDEPSETAATEADDAATARAPAPPMQEVLIGEMCPEGAAGRPAIAPMFARRLRWLDDSSEVVHALERQLARQFSVFAWDGRRVGVFSVAGTSEAGAQGTVAIGSYAGASPCQPPAASAAEVKFDEGCVQSLSHCGLAVARLEPSGGVHARPYEESPDPAAFAVGGACVSGDKLLVDIDSDGRPEAFPVAQFLDPVRAPAGEVVAVDRGDAECEPRFAIRGAVPAGDPRDWRGLDVLGVIDLDGDGRSEIIVAYHYSDRRTWAVYSAQSSVGRLDLVGEAVPWLKR